LRRLLASAVLVALICAGAATAGRGDPQEQLTPADNKRAKSMVLRKADFGTQVNATRVDPPESAFYCRAVDESDLTLTGRAVSPAFFGSGVTFAYSEAELYETVADASAAWRRGVSAAGLACLRKQAAYEIRKTTTRLFSFEKVTTLPFAQRSLALRAVYERADGIRIYADLLVLKHSRAFVAIVFNSPSAPAPRDIVVRLTGSVAARMKTAMRGA
jgi:hypothetical protein